MCRQCSLGSHDLFDVKMLINSSAQIFVLQLSDFDFSFFFLPLLSVEVAVESINYI